MDNAVRLIEAIAKLASALAWPAVALIILWWFGLSMRQFLASISEGSFKAFGVEGSAKRVIVEQALVSADFAKKDPEVSVQINLPSGVGKSAFAADYAAKLLRDDRRFDAKPRRLLWVDDQPTNNIFETRALEGLGFSIDVSVSTDEALSSVAKSKYDVIVSDNSRPGDADAGKTLLRKLREDGNETPLIVYSSNDTADFAHELKDAGAFAATHLASELVIRVAEAVDREGSWSRLSVSERLRHLRSSS